MKKFAFALAAVALTGAMAFAEDAPVVKVTGYVDTGIKSTVDQNGNFSTIGYASDYDGDSVATVGKIGVSVTGANYGATATVKQADNVALGIADAYGWYSPVAGLVLDFGTTYSKASFDGVDDNSPDYFWVSNGYGVTYSNSGLTVGVQSGYDAKNPALVNIGFGAAIDVAKVGAVHFSGNALGKNLNKFGVSANLTAVDKLGLSAGYASEGIDTTADNQADVAVSYAVTDALSAGIVAYDKITKEFFTVKPNASYVVVPGVTVSGYYQLYTEGKDKAKNPADNEVQGKVAVAAGAGTLSAWVRYNTQAKVTLLATDYVISF